MEYISHLTLQVNYGNCFDIRASHMKHTFFWVMSSIQSHLDMGAFVNWDPLAIWKEKIKNKAYQGSTVFGLAYQQGKDIVFWLIIEYSSLRDFGP